MRKSIKPITKTPPHAPAPQLPRAGLLPRLGAWACDATLVLLLLLIAAALGFVIALLLVSNGLLPLGEHADVPNLLAHSLPYIGYLAAVICGYFLWFWCRSGQTPGLRLFNLRVQNRDGSPLKVGQALVRMFTSAFGLGNLLVLLDRNKLAFQDHWGECEVVVLEKR
ncbi:MAG: RDD family protein [Aeromonadaceae bacterium]